MSNSDVLFGLLIPFIGTVLGSALVFITDSELKGDFKLIMTGMAGGTPTYSIYKNEKTIAIKRKTSYKVNEDL